MRRSSRIYLNSLNKNKAGALKEFLHSYSNSLNYSITRLWSSDDVLDGDLVDKSFTNTIRDRFNTTARLSQCIAKQAKEMVLSQRKKSIKKQRIPRFHHSIANLDSRFVTIEKFNGHFNMCLKFGSGVPKLVVPFNWTKHTNKFISSGWTLGKSIILGYDNGLFIDLIFEKEKSPKRTEGKVIGIDRGFRSMLYSSDGQDIGTELKDKIKVAGKRKKSHQHFITTEENRFIKQLNLTDVKTIVLENLKSVKRGKFSRNVNRLLSFWHYAKVGTRLEQICEELGVSIQYKNPWKTSQRCPECGNIDRRNRNGKRFLCLSCGHQDDADHIGARNLEALGLAEVYSLRSLPSKFNGGE
jgi:IS605 OrfB family transposase